MNDQNFKYSLHQNSIFIKFLKNLKIHEIFCENPRIIFDLFYDVHKENMFTINLEDGREAPYKASKINSKIFDIRLLSFSGRNQPEKFIGFHFN